MDIDIYQQCPCHPDKKIKFCCGKNIVSDLNQVMSKNRSGQSHAALDQLDRLISKEGEKDCLLTIKTHIHLSLGEIEKAKAANTTFVANNPKHTTGLQHKSMIAMAEQRVDESVNYLQDAMDSITGSELPISLAQAFRLAGLGLLQSGRVLAARAHLQFAQFLKGDQDQELLQLEMETYRMPGISAFLKSDFRLSEAPDDVPWKKTHSNVLRAMLRGQFRKALKLLQKIDQEYPNETLVKRGLAVAQSFVGDEKSQTEAWLEYAKCDGHSNWQAIEAFGVAQLLNREPDTEVIDIARVTFEINDIEKASELAISSKRLTNSEPLSDDPFGEGPAPKHSFLLLSNDQVESAADMDFDKVPLAIGEVMMYGRQTDRAARIELITVKDDNFDNVLSSMTAAFSDVTDGSPNTQKINQIDCGSHSLNWNWMLPQDINREQHEELLTKTSWNAVSKWADLKFADLDGKSLREAAKDAKSQNQVQAKLLILNEFFRSAKLKKNVGLLREDLGLPELETVDPTQVETFSVIQQEYIDVEKLDDEALLSLQTQSMTIGNVGVMKRTIPELLKRPHLDSVPRDVCYTILARNSEAPEEALEHFASARAEATKAGRPIGIYLVHEFEYRLANGLTEKLDSLIEVIQSRHMKEPEVAYELTRVLQQFGVIGTGQEAPAGGPPPAATPPAESAGGIWTPEGGGSEPAPAAESDAPSKLWIPD